jgi:hypothetical protein
MAGGKIMDMPFASFWKIENGKWCWYYNKEAAHHTPFGDIKDTSASSKPGDAPSSLPAPPNVSIAALQSALKIDQTRIQLVPGKPQTIHVTNTLPGPASLTVGGQYRPLSQSGIKATLDKKDLKGNETAALTMSVDADAPTGVVPVLITVSPTNQVLYLSVTVARE